MHSIWGRRRVQALVAWLGICVVAFSTGVAQAGLLPKLTSRAKPIADPRPASLPTDAALEQAGARIGVIRFESRELFDSRSGDESTSLFRLANRLHIQTRDSTVADQLLFRTGDAYQGRLLDESARVLRSTRYLRDAQVRPVAYHDGLVDIVVITQDVWTFNPGVSVGRKGGKNTSGFELQELNFLGLGTQLGIGYKSGIDRDSKSIFYRDRQLGSTWWGLSSEFSDNSDGRRAEFALDRPFYALDTPWAAGAALLDDRHVDARYDLGVVVDRYEAREKFASLYVGRSSGLRDGWVTRYRLGATLDEWRFANAPGVAAARLLPADRRWLSPWVEAEWLQDDFRTVRNRDQIEKTEDYQLGWRARARMGYSMRSLGADQDAALFELAAAKGWALSDRQTLLLDAAANGRVAGGRLAGTLVDTNARYYFRQSARRVLFLGLSGQWGTGLDANQQILLGGDNGLRGYPLRYQAGSRRWLFTAEQRFFTNWYPFQLFNVGAAVFYDMGAVAGRDPLGTRPQGILKDVGLGLRLGNSRSALGNVLHLDVAVPLDGNSSIQNVQFLIETKRKF